MHRFHPIALSCLLALGLSACGGGGGASSNGSGATIQGVLVDDLVIGATMFCDTNNNGQLDDGEASTTTGEDGSYRLEGCSSGTLTSVAGTGYDRSTLRAPKGSFKARHGSSVVSPFTTMQLASGLDDAAFRAVLTKLGLSGVDAHTYVPTDDQRGPKAAAVAKVLNEIADTVESLGGDPAAAFNAAVVALVAQVQAAPEGTDFAGNATARQAAILAAATAGLATLPAGTLDSTAAQRAAELLAEGLQRVSGRIAARTRYDDIRDDFSSSVVTAIVSGTDLADTSAYTAAREHCRDDDTLRQTRYIAIKDDVFSLVGTTLPGGERQIPLDDFTAGVDLAAEGVQLNDVSAVRLAMTADAKALPRQGRRVAVGLTISDVAAPEGRSLSLLIEGLRLTRNTTTGLLEMAVTTSSRLYVHARSSDGVTFGSGRTGFSGLDTALLGNTASGTALDLSRLITDLKSRFPSNADLTDQMLAGTGTFEVKLVVSEVDLRHADGTVLDRSSLSVPIPGSTSIARRVRGASITGRLTF